jgi:glycosyltransferase involved in cell wall biosynthesis
MQQLPTGSQYIKVSVIVPVYNVEPYLRRCLDSLVNQTLKDIEIICINDSSSDNSLVILKRYAKKDNRIKIIDFEKNQGVSVARNTGMEAAQGEYIGFCDPDDYVDLDFYEKLYALAKNKNADIAKTARKKIDISSNTEIIEILNPQILKHKSYFTYQFTTAIYRNDMLKKHGVKFPIRIIVSQDVCFLIHAVIVAKNVYVLNNTFYHYVRRDNSANSTIYSSKKMHSVLKSMCLILNRINKAIEKDKYYVYLYALFFRNLLLLLTRNLEERNVKRVARVAIKYFHKYKFSKKLNLYKIFDKSIYKSITTALNEKNEKKLFSLLQEWQKNGCYSKINIKESSLQNRRLYVWGAGADGSKVQLQCERRSWKISAFLDSSKNLKEFNGYKVKRPKQILNKVKGDFFIIISSRNYASEIAKICEQAGLKEGLDFWKPN